jgi:hypothetical protein
LRGGSTTFESTISIQRTTNLAQNHNPGPGTSG